MRRAAPTWSGPFLLLQEARCDRYSHILRRCSQKRQNTTTRSIPTRTARASHNFSHHLFANESPMQKRCSMWRVEPGVTSSTSPDSSIAPGSTSTTKCWRSPKIACPQSLFTAATCATLPSIRDSTSSHAFFRRSDTPKRSKTWTVRQPIWLLTFYQGHSCHRTLGHPGIVDRGKGRLFNGRNRRLHRDPYDDCRTG